MGRSADIVREETIKSKVKFDDIDAHELGIYLRKNMTKEEIERKSFNDILPKYNKEDKDDKSGHPVDINYEELLEDIDNLFNDDFADVVNKIMYQTTIQANRT